MIEPLRRPFKAKGLSLDWLDGKRCLDVGCGNGLYTVALSFLSSNLVIGVDFDRARIAQAKRRYKTIENLDFVVADVDQLPFCPSSFDFILCLRVLHHLKRREQAIAEMKRVLRSGGILHTGEML